MTWVSLLKTMRLIEMTYRPLFWKDGETLTIRELRDILNSISDDDIDYENDEGQIWNSDRDNLTNPVTEVERLNKNDIVLS
jgi:hypothetical protein